MKKIARKITDSLLEKYPKLGINVRINRFLKLFMNQVDSNGKSFKENLDEQYAKYLSSNEKSDNKYIEWLTKDIIKCNILYRISPDEYFMHDLRHKNDDYKASILGCAMKDHLCIEACGSHFNEYFNQLKDKWKFYQIVKPYFKRQVCRIHEVSDFHAFEEFCLNNSRFIVKPNFLCSGKGIHVVDLQDVKWGG